MPNFALSKLDGLDQLPHVRIPIYKLETNGYCEYDAWRAEIQQQGTYDDELDSLDTLILSHAQMLPLSPGKFKELNTNGSDTIKDYEFRTKNLRVYLFKLPGGPGQAGKVIVIGGHNDKKQQAKAIARMRTIKKEYYKQFKE
ncbi:hypothetical protein [Hymenobacter terricola]|uniref:hypothetical protein n=1 Tax=Hymenobacter terricola TaxID=2819236 RepID=UPI001B311731|nr:hypothetical protein [Hymenobacter terricola]